MFLLVYGRDKCTSEPWHSIRSQQFKLILFSVKVTDSEKAVHMRWSYANENENERVINVWNSLPCDITNFSSVKAFKRSLGAIDLSG